MHPISSEKVLRWAGVFVILAMPILAASSIAETTELAGRIVDAAGKPIPGATFYVLTMPGPEVSWHFEVFATAESADGGRFGLEVDQSKAKLDTTFFAARASGHGAAWTMAQYVTMNGASLSDFEMTLPEAGAVKGVVRDAAGDPIQGAAIAAFVTLSEVETEKAMPFLPPCEAVLGATTGADGGFVLEGLPKQSKVVLRAVHPDYAVELTGLPENAQGVPSGTIDVGDEDVALTLKPGGTITGRVILEESGQPAEQAVIRAMAVPTGGNFRWLLLGSRTAETDAEGRYVLTGLAAGQYTVKATHPDWVGTAEVVEVPEGGAAVEQDVKLGKGVLVSGKFVAAEEGEPIADAVLSVRRKDAPGPSARSQITLEPDGSFEFRQAPGEITLFARTPTGSISREQAQRELSLVAGEDQTDLVFEVQPPLQFKGTVLGPDEKPLAGAQVARRHGGSSPAQSEEDGSFALPLPNQRFGEHEHVLLTATHPDLPGHRGVLFQQLADESAATGTIELHPAGTIRGRVVDEDGNPIPSAEVVMWLCFDSTSWTDVRTTADEAGRYEVTDAPAGYMHRVQASADGFGEDRTDEFMMDEGGEFEATDLILQVADQVIEGTAQDEDGNPLPQVRISANGSGTGHRSVMTDDKGRFRIANLVDEELRLHAYHRTGEQTLRARTKVTAGDADVQLVLTPQARQQTPDEHEAAILAGKPAPDLDVASWLVGDLATLDALSGKVVVLAFWDSAHESAAEVIRTLKALQAEYADAGVGIVTVHAAEVDSAALKRLIKDEAITFAVAVDKPASAKGPGATFEKYRVRKPPAVFVVDTEANVAFQDIPLGSANAALARLLEGK